MTSQTDRRSVLYAAIAGATSGLLPRRSRAAAGAVHQRPALHTPAGMSMLATYADGVRALMDKSQFPEADPRSWIFQWYTNAVPSNTSKAAELKLSFSLDEVIPRLVRSNMEEPAWTVILFSIHAPAPESAPRIARVEVWCID